jgi:small ligand-binding sensory domain FIST
VLRAGAGLSTERDSARAATEATAGALRSAGLDRADLLLVFATTPHGPGFGRVTRTAGEVGGTRAVVGCSAAGVLAGQQEIEGGPGVSVLALAGDLGAQRFIVPTSRDVDGARVASEIAHAVDARAQARGDCILVLFADTYNVDLPALLDGLGRCLPAVRVVGGGASEDGSVGEVAVFAGDAASSHAVAGVLLAGDLRVTVGVSHALQRVGPVRRVTAADGRWIVTLDGEPALGVFRSIVLGPLRNDPRRALQVVLAGLATGDGGFIARHLLGIDADRQAIAVGAPVAPGCEMFFGVRDPGSARETLERVLAEQVAAWPEPGPAAAVYVNCVGRGSRFYGVPGLDTAYIAQHLGGLPVAGFFSGAEFAPGYRAAQVHQYTGVLTMLGPGS